MRIPYAVCCLAWMLAARPAALSAEDGGVALFGDVRHFVWEEFPPADLQLEESGELFGLGIEAYGSLIDAVRGRAEARVFAGEVDYDGFIQLADGTARPAKSETEYLGVQTEGVLAVPLAERAGWALSPFAGAGGRFWRREFADRRYGYEEYWTYLYGVFGLELGGTAGGAWELVFRAGLRSPFYNRVTYDLSNLDGPSDVEVEPGRKVVPMGSAEFRRGPFRLGVYYERMRFGESDPDEEFGAFFQPESEATEYGIRAGFML